MIWFVIACVVYALCIAPTAPADDYGTAGRVLIALFISGPALIFFYYCLYRGFVDIGVLHA